MRKRRKERGEGKGKKREKGRKERKKGGKINIYNWQLVLWCFCLPCTLVGGINAEDFNRLLPEGSVVLCVPTFNLVGTTTVAFQWNAIAIFHD